MKQSAQTKEFLKQNKGDKAIRKLLSIGGRKGARKDFDSIIKKASKPAAS